MIASHMLDHRRGFERPAIHRPFFIDLAVDKLSWGTIPAPPLLCIHMCQTSSLSGA